MRLFCSYRVRVCHSLRHLDCGSRIRPQVVVESMKRDAGRPELCRAARAAQSALVPKHPRLLWGGVAPSLFGRSAHRLYKYFWGLDALLFPFPHNKLIHGHVLL